MKKTKIITILVSFFILGCLIIFLWKILCAGGTTLFHGNYESVTKIFEKDKEHLIVVSKYFENSDYETIYIPSSMKSGIMSVEGIHEYIQEPEIVEAIEELKNKGYSVIGKSGSSIYFQRWSNLDSGMGIAYSINSEKLQLEFLTKCEPLLEDNWYYYEEDYNLWKKTNTTNGIPNYLLGEWHLRYAKTRGAGEAGKDYPLEELYGTDVAYGCTLTLCSDGTFSRYAGTTIGEGEGDKGTYILRYDDKILLQHENGATSTVKYLSQSQEIVYYTWDSNQQPINEYYSK